MTNCLFQSPGVNHDSPSICELLEEVDEALGFGYLRVSITHGCGFSATVHLPLDDAFKKKEEAIRRTILRDLLTTAPHACYSWRLVYDDEVPRIELLEFLTRFVRATVPGCARARLE